MSDAWVGEHDPLDDGWALDGRSSSQGARGAPGRTRPKCHIRYEHDALDDGWAIAEAIGTAADTSPSRVDPALKAARIAALDRAVREARRDAAEVARVAAPPRRRAGRETPDYRPKRPTARGIAKGPPPVPARARPRATRPALTVVRSLATTPANQSMSPVDEAPVATPKRRARSTAPAVDVVHAVERTRTPSWPRMPRRMSVPAGFAVGAALGAVLALAVVWVTSYDARGAATAADTSDAFVLALPLAAGEAPPGRMTRVAVAPEEAALELLSLEDEPVRPVLVQKHSLAPTFSDHFAAARAALARDDYEQALAAIDRALAIRANSAGALDFKARLLRDLDETVWALEVATEAVHAAPERAASWLTKGQILVDIGEQEHARFALEYVIDLAPTSRHAARARQVLEQL